MLYVYLVEVSGSAAMLISVFLYPNTLSVVNICTRPVTASDIQN